MKSPIPFCYSCDNNFVLCEKRGLARENAMCERDREYETISAGDYATS